MNIFGTLFDLGGGVDLFDVGATNLFIDDGGPDPAIARRRKAHHHAAAGGG
jgi:hypothetical protein